MDLTGFLFGNVNEDGELEDESVLDKETVVQLSRMGVGAGFGEFVEGGAVTVGGGEDGDTSEEYDSDVDVAKAVDKSPTAVDFADITELAEEGGGEGARGAAEGEEEQGIKEVLFQKGMAFAQAQLSASGSGLVEVSMDTDDYDVDSEEVAAAGSQPLPSNSDDEGEPLLQRADSGYTSASASLPLSDPSSLDLPPSSLPLPGLETTSLVDHITPPSQVTPPPVATPSSLVEAPPTDMSVNPGAATEGAGQTGKIESAIPYLIPKDMTLEQLHAKVRPQSCLV
jgi:hypothetical protein